MTALTSQQERVLQCIEQSIAQKGYPPTLREIAAHFGWTSTNAVACHLRRIAGKGYLEMDRGRARGMRPLRPKEG